MDSFPQLDPNSAVESVARVVAVEGRMAVLEPELSTSCGGCASAALCGTKAGNSRLAARRFTLVNDQRLEVGERVVIGISGGSLVRASAAAYMLPLVLALVAGAMAQARFGGDAAAALGAVAGLAIGVLLGRLWARRATARGELAPRFIRRAYGSDDGCHSN